MAHFIGKQVRWQGKLWIVDGYNIGLDMFVARQPGRNVTYLVPVEEVK